MAVGVASDAVCCIVIQPVVVQARNEGVDGKNFGACDGAGLTIELVVQIVSLIA